VDGTTKTEGTDWNRVVGDVFASAENLATELSTITNVKATAVDAESAIGTMSFTGQPSAGNHFHFNTTTFTEGTGGQWLLGSDLEETLESIVNAINDRTDGEGDNSVAWITSDVEHIKVQWLTKGTAGNAIAFNGGQDIRRLASTG
jgi:hypothetical protein